MNPSVRESVRKRALYRCEYCHIPEEATPFVGFHSEHIIAKQHLIDDSLDNLALSCDRCNAYKGTNLSSIDPDSLEIVSLFNPRKDHWEDHFEITDGCVIVGKTVCGRATAKLLNMNASRRVQLRRDWKELKTRGVIDD
jgi:5-methylcytosine-specific restriction endonuclease McrA